MYIVDFYVARQNLFLLTPFFNKHLDAYFFCVFTQNKIIIWIMVTCWQLASIIEFIFPAQQFPSHVALWKDLLPAFA